MQAEKFYRKVINYYQKNRINFKKPVFINSLDNLAEPGLFLIVKTKTTSKTFLRWFCLRYFPNFLVSKNLFQT